MLLNEYRPWRSTQVNSNHEAHHVRNLGTGVHTGAAELKADIRWLVTGTPINNRITDLYALCKVVGLAGHFSPNKEEIKKLLAIHFSTFIISK